MKSLWIGLLSVGALGLIGGGTALGDRSLPYIHSPSGNIRCHLTASGATCATRKPARAVEIARGLARQRGAASLPTGSRLSYGQTTTIGRISCSSSTLGVTCMDGASGARFLINRQSVEILRTGGDEHPVPAPAAPTCDPNYTGACLRPDVADYDCAGGSGDGPYYTGPVTVVGDDRYALDRDGDGVACEG